MRKARSNNPGSFELVRNPPFDKLMALSNVEGQSAIRNPVGERVAILDLGSQYTQLIARRVRELGVYCEIVRHTTSARALAARGDSAIILSGGPASVTRKGSPSCDRRIFSLGVPVLGICYGMQLMAKLLGGRVLSSSEREYGRTPLRIKDKRSLFYGLPGKLTVWMSHGDLVEKLPRHFAAIADSENTRFAAMADEKRKLYGLQFHPEVVHTTKGTEILRNFLFRIARCRGEWSMSSFVQTSIADLRRTVGSERVLCAVSGGVDSSVLATLVHKAVGDQLTCLFINNGLLRKHETEEVKGVFRNRLGIKLRYVNASNDFLRRLAGVGDPERKRRIIGTTFIRVFEREAKRLGEFKFLAQGTLYPDVIESRSPIGGPSATIKTHHNVGGLPKRMKFKLVEPFRFLFKDEVRAIGKELGLPESVIWRHPFPGPGLAVRVVGPVSRARLRPLREADAIVREELARAGLQRKIWQALAVILPVKAVGVMGDERTYANAIAVRAVTSRDAMTADWARIPHPVMATIASRIINEVKGVNRVLYDVSTKPPGTIEWE